MVIEVGVTSRRKSGPGVMVIATAALRVPTPGADPKNVAESVPGAAVDDAAIVTDCDPPVGIVKVDGVKVRFEMVGAVTVTEPANPLMPVADTITFVVAPAATETDAGFTSNRKSGCAATLICSVTLLGAPPAGVNVMVVE